MHERTYFLQPSLACIPINTRVAVSTDNIFRGVKTTTTLNTYGIPIENISRDMVADDAMLTGIFPTHGHPNTRCPTAQDQGLAFFPRMTL